jgi:oligopeptide/dipeptide ABC transporter ATP-binding protein
MQEPLLVIENLQTAISSPRGLMPVIDRLNLTLEAGETLGLIGESGSGKTMTGMAIMDLLPKPQVQITGGRLIFQGQDLLRLTPRERQRLRGARISMIFQDPMASLSPFYTIGSQIAEAIHVHQYLGHRETRRRVCELLDDVVITEPERRMRLFPHQMSGGMRQRVMIAMALAHEPDLLIADEPTTALDVTIQDQILKLLAQKLAVRPTMSLLLVSHNWGVIAALCQRVAVMYAGRLVEEGRLDKLSSAPAHPYTQGLLDSIPDWDHPTAGLLPSLPGQAPALSATRRTRCDFLDRCSARISRCHTEAVPWHSLPEGHGVRCHLQALSGSLSQQEGFGP